jgi:hypothetical protein
VVAGVSAVISLSCSSWWQLLVVDSLPSGDDKNGVYFTISIFIILLVISTWFLLVRLEISWCRQLKVTKAQTQIGMSAVLMLVDIILWSSVRVSSDGLHFLRVVFLMLHTEVIYQQTGILGV